MHASRASWRQPERNAHAQLRAKASRQHRRRPYLHTVQKVPISARVGDFLRLLRHHDRLCLPSHDSEAEPPSHQLRMCARTCSSSRTFLASSSNFPCFFWAHDCPFWYKPSALRERHASESAATGLCKGLQLTQQPLRHQTLYPRPFSLGQVASAVLPLDEPAAYVARCPPRCRTRCRTTALRSRPAVASPLLRSAACAPACSTSRTRCPSNIRTRSQTSTTPHSFWA